jgi:hypothetical protein
MFLLAYGALDVLTNRPGTAVTLGGDLTSHLAAEGSLTHTFCRKDCEVQAMRRELRLKLRPMAGSFYFNFGYGVEEMIWDPSRDSPAQKDQFTVHTMTNGTMLSLGNLWRPGGVVIGADWFGFYAPGSPRIVGTRETQYYDPSQDDDRNERSKERAREWSIWACRFHLGVSF